jgi:hypothetical protein
LYIYVIALPLQSLQSHHVRILRSTLFHTCVNDLRQRSILLHASEWQPCFTRAFLNRENQIWFVLIVTWWWCCIGHTCPADQRLMERWRDQNDVYHQFITSTTRTLLNHFELELKMATRLCASSLRFVGY